MNLVDYKLFVKVRWVKYDRNRLFLFKTLYLKIGKNHNKVKMIGYSCKKKKVIGY